MRRLKPFSCVSIKSDATADIWVDWSWNRGKHLAWLRLSSPAPQSSFISKLHLVCFICAKKSSSVSPPWWILCGTISCFFAVARQPVEMMLLSLAKKYFGTQPPERFLLDSTTRSTRELAALLLCSNTFNHMCKWTKLKLVSLKFLIRSMKL